MKFLENLEFETSEIENSEIENLEFDIWKFWILKLRIWNVGVKKLGMCKFGVWKLSFSYLSLYERDMAIFSLLIDYLHPCLAKCEMGPYFERLTSKWQKKGTKFPWTFKVSKNKVA